MACVSSGGRAWSRSSLVVHRRGRLHCSTAFGRPSSVMPGPLLLRRSARLPIEKSGRRTGHGLPLWHRRTALSAWQVVHWPVRMSACSSHSPVISPLLTASVHAATPLTHSLKAHFTSLLSTISFTLYALLPNLEPALFAAYPVETTSQALQAKSVAASAPEPSAQPTTGTETVGLHRQITQDDSDGGVGALGSPADTGTTEPTPASTPADSLLLAPPPDGSDEHEPAGYTTDGGTAERSASRAPAPGTLAESLASVASSTSSTEATEVTMPAESWASEFTRTSEDEMVSRAQGAAGEG